MLEFWKEFPYNIWLTNQNDTTCTCMDAKSI